MKNYILTGSLVCLLGISAGASPALAGMDQEKCFSSRTSLTKQCKDAASILKKSISRSVEDKCKTFPKKSAIAPQSRTQTFYGLHGSLPDPFPASVLKSMAGGDCLLNARLKVAECKFECKAIVPQTGNFPMFDISGDGLATVTVQGGRKKGAP